MRDGLFGVFFLGLLAGAMVSIFLVAWAKDNGDSFRQSIICESYLGGTYTEAGCVVKDKVVKVELSK